MESRQVTSKSSIGSIMANNEGRALPGPSRQIYRDSSAVSRLSPTSSMLGPVHRLNRGATSLIRRGEDIHVVQRLMGHSNIATTSRYLHLSDADLIEAIDRAFPEG